MLVEFKDQADHVHLLVANPPTPAISDPIQRINGRSTCAARRTFTGRCAPACTRGPLGLLSYFAVSGECALPWVIEQHIDDQPRPL
jgi:putative transposase